ncbi:hypothetical protein LYZ86_15455 [Xanthomonas hortorum pv. cynarae]|uniref:hypothetical protein n=1 Tax=Xanthomonas hortorum TaxID=56454 RepID=UPI0011B01D9D|nr:hypothetical protein [Xanthomonas hortorum]MCE4350618.1 hypothetical protein [Xanthomonas hortorum pv. cynarae]
MTIRDAIRNLVLTKDEQDALAFHAAYVNPARFFFETGGKRWDPRNLSFTILGDKAAENISWGLSTKYGWVQNITIAAQGGTATIGHFGIAKDFLRMGLATRLIHSVGRQLKLSNKVSVLQFQNNSPAYTAFFTSLGASQSSPPSGNSYSWVIP